MRQASFGRFLKADTRQCFVRFFAALDWWCATKERSERGRPPSLEPRTAHSFDFEALRRPQHQDSTRQALHLRQHGPTSGNARAPINCKPPAALPRPVRRRPSTALLSAACGNIGRGGLENLNAAFEWRTGRSVNTYCFETVEVLPSLSTTSMTSMRLAKKRYRQDSLDRKNEANCVAGSVHRIIRVLIAQPRLVMLLSTALLTDKNFRVLGN